MTCFSIWPRLAISGISLCVSLVMLLLPVFLYRSLLELLLWQKIWHIRKRHCGTLPFSLSDNSPVLWTVQQNRLYIAVVEEQLPFKAVFGDWCRVDGYLMMVFGSPHYQVNFEPPFSHCCHILPPLLLLSSSPILPHCWCVSNIWRLRQLNLSQVEWDRSHQFLL